MNWARLSNYEWCGHHTMLWCCQTPAAWGGFLRMLLPFIWLPASSEHVASHVALGQCALQHAALLETGYTQHTLWPTPARVQCFACKIKAKAIGS